MPKELNTIEKKLKFHCSVCFTIYQLQEVKQSLKTNKDTKCLNNCLEKWQSLFTNYCQEQIILDLARKEQVKDEQKDELAKWVSQIKKNNQK